MDWKARELGLDSHPRDTILVSIAFRQAVGHTHLVHEADHSPNCDAEVKSLYSSVPLPHALSWHGT